MTSSIDISGSPDLALRVGRLENDVHDIYAMVGAVQTEQRSQGRRLGRIEVRLDGIDGRLDAHDARFDAIDTRFDAIDTRFDAIESRLDGKLDRILEILEPRAPA